MAVMDFKLLVLQDLKTYCVVGADAIGVALSSWKALKNGEEEFIYTVKGKSFFTKQMEKDVASGKRKENKKTYQTKALYKEAEIIGNCHKSRFSVLFLCPVSQSLG